MGKVDLAIKRAEKLLDQGALAKAETLLSQWLLKAPDNARLHFQLGLVLEKASRQDAAVLAYREAIRLDARCTEAFYRLGVLLHKNKEWGEAENMFLTALREEIDAPEVHFSFASLLDEWGRLNAALYHFKRAAVLQPEHAVAHERIGEACRKLDLVEEARESLNLALSLDANLSQSWCALGLVDLQCSDIFGALENYAKALKIDPNYVVAAKNLALTHNYIKLDKSVVFEAHRKVAEIAQRNANLFNLEPLRRPLRRRRVRIGMVSGDFCVHSVSYFLMPVLRELNHINFEFHAFYARNAVDSRTREFQSLFHYWHQVDGMKAEALAREIRSHDIDILIDLAGYTSLGTTDVFAARLAPIQMAWIGYPNTTGLAAMDYRLTDKWTDPEGCDDEYYSEERIRMPRTFLCYAPLDNDLEVSLAPVVENGYITFGSFNQRRKISDECLDAWASVLRAIPSSRMIIKSVIGVGSQVQKMQFLDGFARRGVAPERVTLLEPENSTSDHLAHYSKVDIALDTFPYNGTTTTCEALWQGVPLLTIEGDRHASRVGVSLLRNIGMPEFIAQDVDDLVRIAVDLAGRVDDLVGLRSEMRRRLEVSHLFDAKAMARDLEKVWMDVWERCLLENSISAQTADVTDSFAPPVLKRLAIGHSAATEGWVVVATKMDEGVDVVGDAINLSHFDDDSCSDVYCAHQLQRLPTADVIAALKEMYRVLRPGGKLYVSVPDMDELSSLFINPSISRAIKFKVMRQIFGLQSTEDDFNKTGLNFEFMTDMLRDVGFASIEHVEDFGLFDDASKTRVVGALISLNLIVTK